MQDEGITNHFYELMQALHSIHSFLLTLQSLGVLTKDQARVIYHQHHVTCVRRLKNKA